VIFTVEKKWIYCPTCEDWVIPGRKNFQHMYHELLCFMIFLTFGLGFFVYLILKYSKKKNICPNCQSVLDLSQAKTREEIKG